MKNLAGEKVYLINCVDWGTGLQQVGLIGGDSRKTAENTWRTFCQAWIRFFGVPEVVVCDPGLEFAGYFADRLAHHGGAQLQTDRQAPWQNGRTERAGKEWKRQFKLARRKEEPLNADEWEALGLECAGV